MQSVRFKVNQAKFTSIVIFAVHSIEMGKLNDSKNTNAIDV